jgi:hypothetical protein
MLARDVHHLLPFANFSPVCTVSNLLHTLDQGHLCIKAVTEPCNCWPYTRSTVLCMNWERKKEEGGDVSALPAAPRGRQDGDETLPSLDLPLHPPQPPPSVQAAGQSPVWCRRRKSSPYSRVWRGNTGIPRPAAVLPVRQRFWWRSFLGGGLALTRLVGGGGRVVAHGGVLPAQIQAL